MYICRLAYLRCTYPFFSVGPQRSAALTSTEDTDLFRYVSMGGEAQSCERQPPLLLMSVPGGSTIIF